MSGPFRATVVLKVGSHASTLKRSLEVESQRELGPVQVELQLLRRQRVRLSISASRPSLLRATLKAYLQWAAISDRLGHQIDHAHPSP